MSHFTYNDEIDRKNLKQGDILFKTPAINKMLDEIHPHYFKNEDYKYFMILTQSCDLERHDGKLCKTPYITIASVRPLKTLIIRYLTKYQSIISQKNKVCADDNKSKFGEFLDRLFNNNEPDYFYLHENPDFQFNENCVAFLKLSISVKADKHYITFLDAKIMELKDSFAAKLGWMVGNMYSRVGTKDWKNEDPNTFKNLRKDILTNSVKWVKGNILNSFEKVEQVDDLSYDDYHNKLDSFISEYKTDKVKFKNCIHQILENFLTLNSGKVLNEKLINSLSSKINTDSIVTNILNKLD